MISRPFLFLGAISLYSATTVSTAGGGLRKEALKVAQQELMCQLATLHTTYMSDDNKLIHEEQSTCTLVENGVPTPSSYPIILPNDFFEQHENKIEFGQLLVSIRGASLVAGEYVLEDYSEITVFDGDFSPPTTGRKLLDQKDPRDAAGERRLIAFRVNGVASEKQVRITIAITISLSLYGTTTIAVFLLIIFLCVVYRWLTRPRKFIVHCSIVEFLSRHSMNSVPLISLHGCLKGYMRSFFPKL
jgi:hypothetical protein